MPHVDTECVTHHICECKERKMERLESLLSELLCNCGMIDPRKHTEAEIHRDWCRYRRTMERMQ